MNVSPCLNCTRVADPRGCDNKDCRVWQKWFIGRWDELRLQPRRSMEQLQTRPGGVCIGGTYYAPPHRVERYLRDDPCAKCLCPRDVCTLPCKLKRTWLQAREDTFITN